MPSEALVPPELPEGCVTEIYRVLLPVVIVDGCTLDLPAFIRHADTVAGQRALLASLARTFHVCLSFIVAFNSLTIYSCLDNAKNNTSKNTYASCWCKNLVVYFLPPFIFPIFIT